MRRETIGKSISETDETAETDETTETVIGTGRWGGVGGGVGPGWADGQ